MIKTKLRALHNNKFGPRSGKTGLNNKNFDFSFSTFSINDVLYYLNAKRTMSLTLLMA